MLDDSFWWQVPSSDEVDEIRDELLKRIFVQGQVQEWDDAGQCWKVINVEAACGEAAGDDQEADDHSARDRIHYGELLLEGRINPYPIGITEVCGCVHGCCRKRAAPRYSIELGPIYSNRCQNGFPVSRAGHPTIEETESVWWW